MKIKPLFNMTMLHIANNCKVYLNKGKVYSARWATSVPNWEAKQKVFVKLNGAEFVLIKSEYQIVKENEVAA